jgi:hypothetical protein
MNRKRIPDLKSTGEPHPVKVGCGVRRGEVEKVLLDGNSLASYPTVAPRRSVTIFPRLTGWRFITVWCPSEGGATPLSMGVSPLPRGNRLFGCCCFLETMLLKRIQRQVAAFARAPRTSGGTSQFLQGAPAAEYSMAVVQTITFPPRFAPHYRHTLALLHNSGTFFLTA